MHIKELLKSDEVRAALEEELQEALKDRIAELDSLKEGLEKEKAQITRTNFIAKKALLNKVSLYETKLKTFYELQFDKYKKDLAANIFTHITESVKTVTTAVEKDAVTNTKLAKVQEAFSKATRILAPHMNINELASANSEAIEKLRTDLNSALKENKQLKDKDLQHDVSLFVATESAKLSDEDKHIVVESLKQIKPTTLVEAKAAFTKVVETIEKKKIDAVLESVTAVLPKTTAKGVRAELKEAVAVVTAEREKLIQESTTNKAVGPLTYDITASLVK